MEYMECLEDGSCTSVVGTMKSVPVKLLDVMQESYELSGDLIETSN